MLTPSPNSAKAPQDTNNKLLQQQAKIGLGVSIEAAPEELQDQQEALGAQTAPNIPF